MQDVKRDWKKILLDLRNAKPLPVSTSKVADLVDEHRSTIQRLLDGAEPRHSLGEKLIELHDKYCSNCTT
jgi:hypothetical protein